MVRMGRSNQKGIEMAKFTYLVTVEVPDETLDFPAGDDFNERYDGFAEEFTEGVGPQTYSPQSLSEIVMAERLTCEDDYGFKYYIEYGSAG